MLRRGIKFEIDRLLRQRVVRVERPNQRSFPDDLSSRLALVRLLLRELAKWRWTSVFLQFACSWACSRLAPSSPWIRAGADGQESHSGCSVKYGAMCQPASKASFTVSNVPV